MLALLLSVILYDFDNGRAVMVQPDEQLVVKLITPEGENRWQVVLSPGLTLLATYREPYRDHLDYQVFVFRALGQGMLGIDYRGLTRYIPPARSYRIRVNSY